MGTNPRYTVAASLIIVVPYGLDLQSTLCVIHVLYIVLS